MRIATKRAQRRPGRTAGAEPGGHDDSVNEFPPPSSESEALRDIINATARELKLPAVLDQALRATLRLTGLEGGTVCLVNPQEECLELAASVNASPEVVADLTSHRIRIGDCLCGQCASQCQPLVLWDNASGSVFATREATRNEGIRFHAAFPLRGRQRCIGVLCLFAKSDRKPTQRSLALVQSVCGPIALTIENTLLFQSAQREIQERAQAEEKLQRTNRTLRLLSRCNQALLCAREEGLLLEEICRLVVEDGGYRMAWVGFPDADEARSVRPVAEAGFEAGYLETLGIVWSDTERGRGPAGTAIRTGQPCVIQNVMEDARFEPWRAEAQKRGYASAIGCPLLAEGCLLGALTIYAGKPEVFDADELKLLGELAGNLAFGLVALRTRAERAEAARALRARAHLLAESQRIAHIGTWSMALGAERIDWTEETYRIYGVAPGELVPTIDTLLRLVHPDDRARMQAWIGQCLAGQRPGELEFRAFRPGGELRTLSGQGDLQYGPGGAPSGIVGTVQDITERKQAEEALRASTERLALAHQAANAGTWDWDVPSGRLVWSEELFKLFGLEVSAEPSFELWRSAMHPEDVAGAEAQLAAAIRGKTQLESEYRVVHPDGQTRWISALGRARYDAQGRPLRMAGICLDVTERKAFQAELQRLVAERTAQLAEANANLQNFAHTAAHDLRSPLRGISSFAALIAQRYGERLDPLGRSLLERVVESAGQMGQLLTDLLEYSKTAQAELPLEPVKLDQAVREALALTEGDARAKGAQVDLPGSLPVVVAHPATLVMILSNLVGNGLKFVAPGVRPHLRIWAEGQARVRLWVEDNGIGIAPEDQAKVFEAFQRLHAKSAYPGTGLGLAIVRKGVERMGGRVGVESKLGSGSRFWVELKAAR